MNDRVNVERAAKVGSRNSGHNVQGHVDNTGTIIEKWTEGESLWIRVKVPKSIIPYIVKKGFIAVDGTSLTVVDVNEKEEWFTFMLVQFTQHHVIIPSKAVGEELNIEVDPIAKYVENAIRLHKL